MSQGAPYHAGALPKCPCCQLQVLCSGYTALHVTSLKTVHRVTHRRCVQVPVPVPEGDLPCCSEGYRTVCSAGVLSASAAMC